MTTYLIQVLFGATILLLTAIILCTLFRKAAASLRYRIWTFTMLGVLLLPILSPLLPTTLSVPVANSDSLRNLPVAALMDDAGVNAPADTSSQSQRSQSPTPKQGNENVPTLAYATGSVGVGSVIAAIWLTGTALLLAHLLLSILAVRKMLAPWEHLTDPLLDTLRKELGIKKPVRLICCNAGTVPFISGIVRPTIVLPPQSRDWSEPEHRAVLTHELAHVARHDLFWQLLSQVVCAVYWFHPLVWFAAYRIGIERESACDDTVVLRGEKPSAYADLLLELANGLRKQRIGLPGCTVAITRKNTIGKRIQAILNPNICRTPLGKIGTGLFLLFAVGAVVLIATVSPFAKQEIANEEDELAKFAVSKDAPKITVSGQVLNPDGTPTDREFIFFNTLTIREHLPASSFGKPSYYPNFDSSGERADKEGNFSRNLPIGTYVMVYAYSATLPRKLVSQPVVFRAEKDRHITLQLLEGIPVYGKAMFDDGTPVRLRTIEGTRSMIPSELMGDVNIANANNFRHNFALQYQAPIQDDSTFELYLPPGEFLISETNDDKFVHAVPLSVKDVEKDKEAPKEYRIALTLPAPLRGKFVKEDGSDPGSLKMLYMAKSENHTSAFSTYITSGGEFSLNKRTGSWLVAVTRDGTFGVIHPIADDQLSVFQTIVLQPTATIKLELRDRLGQPVVGERVSVSVVSRLEHSSSSAGFSDTPSITDEEGIAVFRVPPGRGFYEFSWEGGKLASERTFSAGETVVIPAAQ